MRTILFRGKAEDGQWLRGSLILDDPIAGRGCAYIDNGSETPAVARESVGQFITGIDGQEAFEGDFIEIDYDGIFDEGRCRGLLEYSWEGATVDFLSHSIPLDAACFDLETAKIVGNFTDNPEMWETCGVIAPAPETTRTLAQDCPETNKSKGGETDKHTGEK